MKQKLTCVIGLALLTGCAATKSSGFYIPNADGTRAEIPLEQVLPIINSNVAKISNCLITAETFPAVKDCITGKPTPTPTPIIQNGGVEFFRKGKK